MALTQVLCGSDELYGSCGLKSAAWPQSRKRRANSPPAGSNAAFFNES